MEWRGFGFMLCGLSILLLLCIGWVSPVAASEGGLSVVWLGDLDFGQLLVQSPGSVRVAASAGCQRVVEVGDILDMGHCSAARFLVSGDANRSYVVSLPTSSVEMPPFGDWWEDGFGPAAANFVAATSNIYVLGADGTDTLYVGGTLHIGAGLPHELYFGVLDVLVELQ